MLNHESFLYSRDIKRSITQIPHYISLANDHNNQFETKCHPEQCHSLIEYPTQKFRLKPDRVTFLNA